MRTVRALSRFPCGQRTVVLAIPLRSSASCGCRGHLDAYLGTACLAVRRERRQCVAVRSCAVAAPQRHHTLFKSELGYRTDLAEQYSLLEIIGKGNFGTVWLAASRHDPSQQVAVKVLPKTRSDRAHEDSVECIKREVAMWGCLSGDSHFVAQLLGLYEDSSSVYLVQQLCSGGDLGSVLKDAPLPESSCSAIMWCVLSAIRDCHEHQLALIDVKPQNFLLTAPPAAAGGRPISQLRLSDQVAGGGAAGPAVVACDFGCSLSYSDLMRGAKRAGSPVFFAPEQFTSSYGLGVDVWAAGVMMYLLLTGRYPFWDSKREDLESKLPAYQVMLAVCSAPISFSGPEWRGLSREARELVSLMLDRNPATRITAQQALQHPWFAHWLREEAAASGAAADGESSQDGARSASSRSSSTTSRRALRQQQQQQLWQRHQQQQQERQQARKPAGAGAALESLGAVGTTAGLGLPVRPGCARAAAMVNAGATPLNMCCSGGSNIVPLTPNMSFGTATSPLWGSSSQALVHAGGAGTDIAAAAGQGRSAAALMSAVPGGEGDMSGASGDEASGSASPDWTAGTDDDDGGSASA